MSMNEFRQLAAKIDQLMALSDEFSGFYRYALFMEEVSEVERNKPSRLYDGMSQLPERQKQMGAC